MRFACISFFLVTRCHSSPSPARPKETRASPEFTDDYGVWGHTIPVSARPILICWHPGGNGSMEESAKAILNKDDQCVRLLSMLYQDQLCHICMMLENHITCVLCPCNRAQTVKIMRPSLRATPPAFPGKRGGTSKYGGLFQSQYLLLDRAASLSYQKIV